MFKRLADRLKGKPANPPPGQLRSLSKDDPRPQFYMFAHRVLPYLFFQNPELLLKILSQPNGLEFLRMQWNSLAKHVADAEPPTLLNYETRRLDDETTIILITMPTPRKATETYFIGVAHRHPTADKAPLARYFTLEYGADFIPDEPQRTVLGEWTAAPQHINYGGNFVPEKSAFFKTICDKLNEPVGQSAHASFVPPSQ